MTYIGFLSSIMLKVWFQPVESKFLLRFTFSNFLLVHLCFLTADCVIYDSFDLIVSLNDCLLAIFNTFG